MKTQVWVYIVVAVLSAGAGVAIAGLPSSTPREPTIIPPTTTETTTPSVEESAAVFEPVASDDESTDVEPEGTADAGDEEPVATEPTTTSIAETTTTTTTTTTTLPLPERSVFPVAVANGSGGAGIASSGAAELVELGYDGVRALDGDEIVELSIVYYGPDLERLAVRLATDLGLADDRIAELDGAPSVPSLQDEPLLVYLGLDAIEG